MHNMCYPPPWMGLDLLSTFVLTPILLLQRKIRTSWLRMLSRRLRLHPTLPVVLALCKMPPLARYSKPNLDFILVVLWSIVVAFLVLIIVHIECPPPWRLYSD